MEKREKEEKIKFFMGKTTISNFQRKKKPVEIKMLRSFFKLNFESIKLYCESIEFNNNPSHN